MAELNAYRPSSVSSPGDALADILEDRDMSQAELAARLARPLKTVNEIIKGKTAITAETALQLERALGVPARFWLQREADYREFQARKAEPRDSPEVTEWLKLLPLREMRQWGWIAPDTTKDRLASACLTFFGVASVEAWRETYSRPLAAFRTSSRVANHLGGIAAWLRQGELQAEQAECKKFDRDAFRQALSAIRPLTCEEDPEAFIPKLQTICSEVGVAVVFVRAPKGCPASGATRWVSSTKAVLQLSARYRTNDHLWFTFFHESAHLILHGKKLLFLEFTREPLNDELEREADRLAMRTLIPAEYEGKLRTIRWNERTVISVAQQLGIAPGILLGRLQKESLVPWPTKLNALKVSYQWEE